jgi:hypothetical protein
MSADLTALETLHRDAAALPEVPFLPYSEQVTIKLLRVDRASTATRSGSRTGSLSTGDTSTAARRTASTRSTSPSSTRCRSARSLIPSHRVQATSFGPGARISQPA